MTRRLRHAALLAPFAFVAGATLVAGVRAAAPAKQGERLVGVAPGRVTFAMTPSGAWRTFGTRGAGSLIANGGVVVTAAGADGEVEVLNAMTGGTASRLPADGVPVVREGAPGGTRYPSVRPDDDGDGRIDEDPLDRVDNDRDGRTDEDFAAIGDEMTSAVYGPGDASMPAVTVRHEIYAWSLSHIENMVAATITVRNTGTESMRGVRAGVAFVCGAALGDDRALAETSERPMGDFDMTRLLIRGRTRGLAMLAFVPRASVAAGSWRTTEERERVLVLSPVLGDLAPGADVTLHLALVAVPVDDERIQRVIHTARRTVMGDGTARFIPPPVPLMSREESAVLPDATAPIGAAPGLDAFWFSSGKLDDALLVGSPNPFRDAITIDYEVPARVTDEDGIEHALDGAGIGASVRVYNVTGRRVATLVESVHSPGRYRTGWTAVDESGGSVASGVYYVKLEIGKRYVTKRLVQLK